MDCSIDVIGREPFGVAKVEQQTQTSVVLPHERFKRIRWGIQRSNLTINVKKLLMLDNYLTIKSLFNKYNTAMPASAPVERLLSVAILVLTTRRSRLSDTLIEHLFFLNKVTLYHFINIHILS